MKKILLEIVLPPILTILILLIPIIILISVPKTIPNYLS